MAARPHLAVSSALSRRFASVFVSRNHLSSSRPPHLSDILPIGCRGFHTTRNTSNTISEKPPSDGSGVPYSSLTIGIPRELFPNERRVALTPQNATLLRKKGFSQVLVERNSGVEAQFLDEQYAAAGATLVSQDELYKASDIVLKVRPPLQGQETELLKEGSTVISFLYPAQNKAIVDTLATRKVNAFAVSVPNTIWSHALK